MTVMVASTERALRVDCPLVTTNYAQTRRRVITEASQLGNFVTAQCRRPPAPSPRRARAAGRRREPRDRLPVAQLGPPRPGPLSLPARGARQGLCGLRIAANCLLLTHSAGHLPLSEGIRID